MAVGGSNVDAAMNWVFEHNDDPDFNDHLPEGGIAAPAAASGDPNVDESVVGSNHLLSRFMCIRNRGVVEPDLRPSSPRFS